MPTSNVQVPQPVRLFHITAIPNLSTICGAGGLTSKNLAQSLGISYANIAHQGAQNSRSLRQAPNPPGGTIHDYVPFYFAPRSPMLSALNAGRVANCSFRQEDIIHFETTVDFAIADKTGFVFYDRNATLNYARGYTSLADLDKVAWELLLERPCLDGFCKYFMTVPSNPRYLDRLERRMAEFLVKDRLALNRFTRLGVFDAQRGLQVRSILARCNVNLVVEVKPEWYF